MEEDKRLQAAGALAAIVAFVLVVVQFSGGRAAPKASSGPGWYARINPFGSAPSADPSPAYERPSPELAAPERVMTNAASRQFSSPTSAGSSGGLAGAEPVSAPAADATPMSAPRLAGGGYVDLPGGGNAPTSGGAASFAPPSGGRSSPPPPSRTGAAAPAAPPPAGGSRASGGGASPAGDAQSAAAASSFGRAAGAGVAGGSTPGASRLGAMDANGVSSRAPGLAETPKLSGSSSSGGGGGGPGDPGGGGGAGKGGSGGMGGAVPGGKPKESAGKPAGVDVSPGGAGGSPVPPGGSQSGGDESSVPAAKTGSPAVGEGVPSGKKFSLSRGGPEVIETRLFRTKKNVPVVGFTAKMDIDGDGPGGGRDGDPTYQKETAYKPNGVSLNARVVPFIVIPGDFSKAHDNVALGDYAAVTYGGKTTFALVGDIGPKGVLGEGSPALARSVGINPSPVSGGVKSASVRYLILPGSVRKPIPVTAAEIQSVVGAAFEAAGAELR